MAKETKKKQEMTTVENVEVLRAYQFDDGTVSFDIKVEDLVIINNMRYSHIEKGRGKDKKVYDIINFPQRTVKGDKGEDDKYFKFAYFFITDDLKDDILEQIADILD